MSPISKADVLYTFRKEPNESHEVAVAWDSSLYSTSGVALLEHEEEGEVLPPPPPGMMLAFDQVNMRYAFALAQQIVRDCPLLAFTQTSRRARGYRYFFFYGWGW